MSEYSAEERLAWDRYAAGVLAANKECFASTAAMVADDLLQERYERFGKQPDPKDGWEEVPKQEELAAPSVPDSDQKLVSAMERIRKQEIALIGREAVLKPMLRFLASRGPITIGVKEWKEPMLDYSAYDFRIDFNRVDVLRSGLPESELHSVTLSAKLK